MNRENQKLLIKEAIKEYQQEETKKKKSKVYHNTELLMKNYNELRQHADNAIYRLVQSGRWNPNDDLNDLEYDPEIDFDCDYENLYINSILKSKMRTTIMVQHINMALILLQKNAKEEGCSLKYEILVELYINKKLTYDDLAEKHNCDPTTIRRWKNDILRRLSILLFGEESLILQG